MEDSRGCGGGWSRIIEYARPVVARCHLEQISRPCPISVDRSDTRDSDPGQTSDLQWSSLPQSVKQLPLRLLRKRRLPRLRSGPNKPSAAETTKRHNADTCRCCGACRLLCGRYCIRLGAGQWTCLDGRRYICSSRDGPWRRNSGTVHREARAGRSGRGGVRWADSEIPLKQTWRTRS